MSFKRSLQAKSTQKKGFSLPKCFQLSGITKSLFTCKSTTVNQNSDNYVIFDYQNKNSTQNSNPATSTMIASFDQNTAYNSRAHSVNRFHVSDITNHSNEYYQLQSNYEQIYRNDAFDLEETRRSDNFSISSINSINEYEEMTIVQHNNSPLSECKTYQSDESFLNMPECLHSTKVSNFHGETQTMLSPLPINKHSTLLESPVLKIRSNFDTNSKNDLSIQIESLINEISAIIETSNETHICTSNYEATFVDDLTVNFADTIRILKDNNDDWLYVQVSTDGRMGFVPRTIVQDIKEFVNYLKENQNRFCQSSLIN